jgi:hypothetical protein
VTDPGPGPIVTGIIGETVEVPADDVLAAVFLLRHPAGNQAAVWVFRAGDATSQEALERWEASVQKCEGPTRTVSLAGLDGVVFRYRFIDQCQPQYLIRLDSETLAVITDNGGYAGNASGTPTVPYRPERDIAAVVMWLQNELKTVELQPGRVSPTDDS